MRSGSSRDVLRQLRTLYRCGVIGHLGDEQLLDRFIARAMRRARRLLRRWCGGTVRWSSGCAVGALVMRTRPRMPSRRLS